MLTIFKSVDCEINDPSTSAEGFCEYFTNLGPALAAKIPGSMNTFCNFLKANVMNSLFWERTNPQEVTDICDGIRIGAAAGYDNISISVVKSTIDIISIPLAHIINLSISSGVVPRELKIASVIPLFKSGDEAVFVNYRPVASILQFFNKI